MGVPGRVSVVGAFFDSIVPVCAREQESRAASRWLANSEGRVGAVAKYVSGGAKVEEGVAFPNRLLALHRRRGYGGADGSGLRQVAGFCCREPHQVDLDYAVRRFSGRDCIWKTRREAGSETRNLYRSGGLRWSVDLGLSNEKRAGILCAGGGGGTRAGRNTSAEQVALCSPHSAGQSRGVLRFLQHAGQVRRHHRADHYGRRWRNDR